MLKINLYTHNFFTQFTVLAVLETKRQKARDCYAKLTDEQKA